MKLIWNLKLIQVHVSLAEKNYQRWNVKFTFSWTHTSLHFLAGLPAFPAEANPGLA